LHTVLIKFEYLQENDKSIMSLTDPMLAYAHDKIVKIKIFPLATKITAIAVVSHQKHSKKNFVRLPSSFLYLLQLNGAVFWN